MPSIALATCTDEASLFYDEAPFVEALENAGFEVFKTIWNSPEIDWQCYDLVLLRNTWDYHRQISAFRAWLNFLDEKNIRVLNPTHLLRWNMDKSYLQELAQQNIKTLPTIFAKGQSLQLENVLAEQNWLQAVLKPYISGSGDNTWTITPETARESQRQFDWLNNEIGMMIQAIAPQIHDDGEYSLIFFAGKYHHAVLKKPPQDSIFVHEERGGTIESIEASPEMIAQAEKALNTVESITGIMPLYARVDGLRDGDDFVLMEMECVEPELYFSRSPGAAERFVSVILEAIS